MAYCAYCGGWDKKQGGVGHRLGCKVGKPGTPIGRSPLADFAELTQEFFKHHRFEKHYKMYDIIIDDGDAARAKARRRR